MSLYAHQSPASVRSPSLRLAHVVYLRSSVTARHGGRLQFRLKQHILLVTVASNAKLLPNKLNKTVHTPVTAIGFDGRERAFTGPLDIYLATTMLKYLRAFPRAGSGHFTWLTSCCRVDETHSTDLRDTKGSSDAKDPSIPASAQTVRLYDDIIQVSSFLINVVLDEHREKGRSRNKDWKVGGTSGKRFRKTQA